MTANGKNGNGHSRSLEAVELARIAEVKSAQLERALSALDRAEEMISRVTGYLDGPDQATLFAMRAVLEEAGKRKPKPRTPWRGS